MVTVQIVSAVRLHYDWFNDQLIPSSRTIVGTVETCSWINPLISFAIRESRTNQLRIVQFKYLLTINGIEYRYQPIVSKAKTIEVKGSKNAIYQLTIDGSGNAIKCSCPGYNFRRTCKHVIDYRNE